MNIKDGISFAVFLSSIMFFTAFGATPEAEAQADIGSFAPNFILEDLEGTKRDLKYFQGKVVLLNFWASWCKPCIKELPTLVRLDEIMNGEDFVLVSVFVNDNPSKARQLAQKYGVKYHVLVDPRGSLKEPYGVSMMPLAYIIDKKGVIREKVAGFSATRSWCSESGVSLIRQYLSD